ncbi:hypothetical protein [Aliihoeflea sp. PC F10.4]
MPAQKTDCSKTHEDGEEKSRLLDGLLASATSTDNPMPNSTTMMQTIENLRANISEPLLCHRVEC